MDIVSKHHKRWLQSLEEDYRVFDAVLLNN